MRVRVLTLTLMLPLYATNAFSAADALPEETFVCSKNSKHADLNITITRKIDPQNPTVCMFKGKRKGTINGAIHSDSFGASRDASRILKELEEAKLSPLPKADDSEALCKAYILLKSCGEQKQ